jgi:carbonic anhydrase
MQPFTNDVIAGCLDSSPRTASIDADGWRDHGAGPGSVHGHFLKWLTFSDLAQSVVDYAESIRSHPLVNRSMPIFGYIYDVRFGKLIELPDATAPDKAAA